jgi:hypothetical protein
VLFNFLGLQFLLGSIPEIEGYRHGKQQQAPRERLSVIGGNASLVYALVEQPTFAMPSSPPSIQHRHCRVPASPSTTRDGK